MEKTLKRIQTLAKVGKVLSLIVFICCIVAVVFVFIGLFGLSQVMMIEVDGKTVLQMIEEEAGQSLDIKMIYPSMISSIIYLGSEAVLAMFAKKYFEHELEAGTPFRVDIAKELTRLGILCICISVGAALVGGIAEAITMVSVGVEEIESSSSNASSVGLGITFLIVGALCRYAAMREEKILAQLNTPEVTE